MVYWLGSDIDRLGHSVQREATIAADPAQQTGSSSEAHAKEYSYTSVRELNVGFIAICPQHPPCAADQP